MIIRLTSQRASAEKGVSSDGFRTTVQPAAIAGAALRVIIALGKFHLKQEQVKIVSIYKLLNSIYFKQYSKNMIDIRCGFIHVSN